ncbi:hypothetical protein SAMN06296952_2163 [Oscillospiraceae bacterium]|nr:hypothetical protein SAMN06296952_2163 [Oscillospiraceae bacterium]
MKSVTKMTVAERRTEFDKYIKNKVKSAPRYIADLEKGFSEAPVIGYGSIYEITDPDLLEDPVATKALRESSVFTRLSVGGTAGLAGLNWYIRFLKDYRDSYYDFLQHFDIKPKELFDWGMNACIFPPLDTVEREWNDLKHRIFNNEAVYIRGYGRDAHGTRLYIDFYKFVFENEHILKDPTNNNKPTSNLRRMTGLVRNKDIYNYQVSHIWGQTKNLFLFEAPWNVCYTPKIIDPFTGHETKGDLPCEFQVSFIKYAQKKYKRFINDYNRIISTYDIEGLLNDYCAAYSVADERFVSDALKELSPIVLI